MMVDESCPNPQTLAAFAEGRLPAKERQAVIEHLAGCEGCYEVVAETLHVLEELAEEVEDLPPQAVKLREFPAARAGRWLLPWAASLAVAALALWLTLPFLQPQGLAGSIPVERLPAGWANPEWASPSRGPDADEAAQLLRIGVLHLDLDAALRGRDIEAAKQAVGGLLAEGEAGAVLHLPAYRSLDSALSQAGSLSRARKQFRRAEDLLTADLSGESRALYLLGRWSEGGRLALLSGDLGVLQGRAYRSLTAELEASPDLHGPYRQGFQELVTRLRNLPRPLSQEQRQLLLDDLDKLVYRVS